jgi:hypothetical protein
MAIPSASERKGVVKNVEAERELVQIERQTRIRDVVYEQITAALESAPEPVPIVPIKRGSSKE